MSRHGFIKITVLIVSAAMIATGCEGFGFSGTTTFPQLAFFESAREAAPEIKATESDGTRSIGASRELAPGETPEWRNDVANPLYSVFNFLREFDPDDLDAGLDRSNFYRVLYDVGNLIPEDLNAFEAPKQVSSPFDFGTETRTYSYGEDVDLTGEGTYEAVSDYAMEFDGDTTICLATYVWREGTKYERGAFEATKNAATGDMDIRFLHLVTYEGGETYSNLVYITGNEQQHTFTLRYLDAGRSSQGWEGAKVAIVGHGVSQSESGDDYFLLKVLGEPLTEARYYKFPAGATETELKAYAWDGYALADIDDPKGYSDTVDGLALLTLEDTIVSVDGFTGGTNDLY
jgi:hypothetical protein